MRHPLLRVRISSRLIPAQSLLPRNPLQGNRPKFFSILAIESSCDDSCVAILDVSRDEHGASHASLLYNDRVTANNIKYGGIHPLRAMESHHANLAQLVSQGLKCTNLQKPDLVAVTRGPGMRNNLQTGIDIAKGLSLAWRVPLLGVHHMQAHALTSRMYMALSSKHGLHDMQPAFPFLSLLVSGGHTLLVNSRSVTEHQILSSTVDIAVGDCLDKIARLILPQHIIQASPDVSFGSLLERFAFGRETHDEKSIAPPTYDYVPPKSYGQVISKATAPNEYGWYLPVPFVKKGEHNSRMADFSFAGVVAHVERIVNFQDQRRTPRCEPMPIDEARALAKAAMECVFEHIARNAAFHLNTLRPAPAANRRASTNRQIPHSTDTYRRPNTLVLGGGVAANLYLRHILKTYISEDTRTPLQLECVPVKFCTDNAAMIAWAAAEMTGMLNTADTFGLKLDENQKTLSMRALRKWSLENLLTPEVEEAREASEEVERDQKRLGKKGPTPADNLKLQPRESGNGGEQRRSERDSSPIYEDSMKQ